MVGGGSSHVAKKKASGFSDSCSPCMAELVDIIRILCGYGVIFEEADLVSLVRTSSGMAKLLEDASVRLDWKSRVETRKDKKRYVVDKEKYVMRNVPRCIKNTTVVQLRTHLEAKDSSLLARWASSIKKFHATWCGHMHVGKYDTKRPNDYDTSTKSQQKEFAKELFRILESMHNLEYLFLDVSFWKSLPQSTFDLAPLKNLTHAYLTSGRFEDRYLVSKYSTLSVSMPQSFCSLRHLLLDNVCLPSSFTPPSSLQVLCLYSVKLGELNLYDSGQLEVLEMKKVPSGNRRGWQRRPVDERAVRIIGFESLQSLKHLKMWKVDCGRVKLDQLSEGLEYIHLQCLHDVVGFGKLPLNLKHLCIREVYGLENENPQAHCIQYELEDSVDDMGHHLVEHPEKSLLLPLVLPDDLDYLSLDNDLCCHAKLPARLKKLCISETPTCIDDTHPYPPSFFKFNEKLELLELRGKHIGIISAPHLSMSTWSNIVSLVITGFGACTKITCPPGLVKLWIEECHMAEIHLPESLEECVLNHMCGPDFAWNSYEVSLTLKKNIKKFRIGASLKSLTFDGCCPSMIHMLGDFGEHLKIKNIRLRNGAQLPKDFKRKLKEDGRYIFGEMGSDIREYMDRGFRRLDNEWKMDSSDDAF